MNMSDPVALYSLLVVQGILTTGGVIATFAALIVWIIVLQRRVRRSEDQIARLRRYIHKLESVVAQLKIDGDKIFAENPDNDAAGGYVNGGMQ